MNKLNNHETLEHHKGVIWVSRTFTTEKRGNICVAVNDDFQVLAYISPNRLENKDLTTVVEEVLKANGTLYMLEDSMITCSVCNKSYNECEVNIVDYEDDVCVNCEKSYVNV